MVGILGLIVGLCLIRPEFRNTKPRDLRNQVVVITGASSGLGRALSETLAIKGCSHLILLDIDETGLSALTKTLRLQARTNSNSKSKSKSNSNPIQIYPYVCDVSNPDTVSHVMTRAKRDIYPALIDIVINNAAIVHGRPFLELSPTQLERTWRINVGSHFWMNQAILPDMIQQRSHDRNSQEKGLIVTISSVMSLFGSAGLTDYCASKWAVTGFHESLRLELIRIGCDDIIDTLLVCPYAVQTGMFEGILDGHKWSRALLPILQTQDVVDSIVRAIETRETVLIGCSPHFLHRMIFPYLGPALHILPTKVMDGLFKVLGGVYGMDTFIGRDSQHNKGRPEMGKI